MVLLNDAEWVKWSDNEIARRCAVSQPFVSKIRPTYNGFKIERTVQRNGTVYQQNTENIGRKHLSVRRILDLRGGKKKGRHIAGREIGEEV